MLPTLIFCVKGLNFNITSYVEYCVDSKTSSIVCNIKIYTIGGFIMFVNFTRIGRRVKEVRNVKGMSQAELAEQIDTSVPYISLIETAAKKASLTTLVLIANALGVTVDTFLSGNLTNDPEEYCCDLVLLIKDCNYERRKERSGVCSRKASRKYCLHPYFEKM